MQDIFGKALLDYQNGEYSEDIITETSISEADVLPIPYLFRTYEEMPEVEQKAIDLSYGDVLEVGCGSGSHGLELMARGLKVKAIDASPGAIEVAKARGLTDAEVSMLGDYSEGKFDTILMLMNGAGLLGPLEALVDNLKKLRSLLKPEGQLLVDSSDLVYMYDQTEEGGILVPADHYYGELEYKISYKGEEESFTWLYVDPRLFSSLAEEAGYNFEIVQTGENFDFLARLTLKFPY